MRKKSIWQELSRYRGAIMGFAALWIYVFHIWNPIFDNYPLLHRWEVFLKTIGFSGVDLFFFLSGLGLVHAIGRQDLPTFYRRRLSRVLPPYFLTATAIALTGGWSLELYLKNLTGWNFYTENIYSLLWFVPAILTFYLIFPLYYRGFEKWGRPFLLTGCAIGVWLALSLGLKNTLRYDLYGFTNRIPVFLLGVLAGHMSVRGGKNYTFLHRLACLLALGLGLCAAYLTNTKGMYLLVPVSNCCVPNVLMAPALCLLLAEVFSILDGKMGGFGRVSVGFFRFFGGISLEFYCVQEWIASLVKPTVEAHLGDLLTNAVVFAAVLGAAVAVKALCSLPRRLHKTSE